MENRLFVGSDGGDSDDCKLASGTLAILVQAGLAVTGAATLIFKRYWERPQRPWLVWFFDVSKQMVSGHHRNAVDVAFRAADDGWSAAIALREKLNDAEERVRGAVDELGKAMHAAAAAARQAGKHAQLVRWVEQEDALLRSQCDAQEGRRLDWIFETSMGEEGSHFAPTWGVELTINEWTHLALVMDAKSHFSVFYGGRAQGVFQLEGTPPAAWFFYNFLFSECSPPEDAMVHDARRYDVMLDEEELVELAREWPPRACGNGIRQPGEECDDGDGGEESDREAGRHARLRARLARRG